jgi:hypothetical protein
MPNRRIAAAGRGPVGRRLRIARSKEDVCRIGISHSTENER